VTSPGSGSSPASAWRRASASSTHRVGQRHRMNLLAMNPCQPVGPGADSWDWRASRSVAGLRRLRASPPPTNLLHLGRDRHRASTSGPTGLPTSGAAKGPSLAPRCSGAHHPARARASTVDAARRRRPAGHLTRAGGPTAPLLGAGPASRGVPIWARSSWPGGCRDPQPRHALARRHRHQRQDRRRSRCSTRSCGRPAAQHRRGQRRAARWSRRSWTPEPYDVLAVELSSFQLHYTDSMSCRGRRRCSTSPRTTSTGTARWAEYAADKGRIYERVAARLRLQRRRPGHRGAGPRGRRGRGRAGDRFHPRHARRSGWLGVVEDILADRAVHRGARDQRRRALHLCAT
jgi:hypothetical protein